MFESYELSPAQLHLSTKLTDKQQIMIDSAVDKHARLLHELAVVVRWESLQEQPLATSPG